MVSATRGGMAVGQAQHVNYYAEPGGAALLRQADRLARKVTVVERTARSSLLGSAATTAEVPFTLRVTLLRGPGDAVTGTLHGLVDAYAALPGGRLVVTGAAGAGKTVLAIELALLLLERRRPEQPVPVRLTLVDWDPGTPLEEWLVRQVSDVYGVRPRAAQALVAQRLVLPVLDGLDEMDGTAGSSDRATRAMDQINRYHGPRGVTPLVVTCRTSTYERVSHDHGGLVSAAVAKVEELDTSQIRDYLEQALAARSEGERRAWAEVIDDLHLLPAGALATPWRLYLATTVYSGGRDPRELLALTTQEDIDRMLVERLIPVAIAATPHRRYDAERIQRWLTSFAVDSTPAEDDPGGRVTDIVPHRLEHVVGRKAVLTVHSLVFALFCAGLLVLAKASSGSSDPSLTNFPLFLGVFFGALGMGAPAEPIRLVRLRRRAKAEEEPFWETARRNDQERWKIAHRDASGWRILLYLSPLAVFPPLVGLLVARWLFPRKSWGVLTLESLGLCVALLVGALLIGAVKEALSRLPTPIVIADTEPVLRPSAPLRQDAFVSVLTVGLVVLCALIWPTVGCTVALLLLPSVAVRAWLRYAVSVAVGGGRRRVPLRLNGFLVWAHQAGLLRTTGRTYQLRHRELQQWLLNEERDRGLGKRMRLRAADGSLSDEERLAAAGELVRLGDPEGTKELYRMAVSRKAKAASRLRAMETLGEMDDLRDVAVDMLTAFADLTSAGDDTEDFLAAVTALARFAPGAALALVQRLATDATARPVMRECAVSILRKYAEYGRAADVSGTPAARQGQVPFPTAPLVRKYWDRPGGRRHGP
ncbi:NACHT domain-containing protein (plasmid) [Streptomyces sp. S501]|uniref:NACHT domain-containing protein n=1 Tax=Streptomyces sp. S501 TaxID=2420135 RepID=UPI00106EBE05|nr:NACHT domain-containing protein [Streptomyces sp. S501]QBR04595.1 NACHT domain-containing protein [Streptomyces sp. S501]